jgi:hypothetical protein
MWIYPWKLSSQLLALHLLMPLPLANNPTCSHQQQGTQMTQLLPLSA